MNSNPPSKDDEQPKAEHGARSEVNWDAGAGHEPYSNQDPDAAAPPHGALEVEEGDRGSASGRNLEQLEAVKTKP